MRTGILESLIQYFSLNSCKLPDLAVLSYRYILLEHYYKKSLLIFFDKIVDFNEFLAVADGKLCDGGLDTFTKTEILLQILKKIKVLHMCNVAKTLKYLFLYVFQILIIPFKFWRIYSVLRTENAYCCGREIFVASTGEEVFST